MPQERDDRPSSALRPPPSAVWLLPIAWLWCRVVDHLRIEWSVNPQYNYGWAVPFLCLYLIWRNALKQKTDALRPPPSAVRRPPSALRPPSSVVRRPLAVLRPLPSSIFYLLFAGAAALYLPTRLLQEANPDWRFVSWALALEVVVITLCVLTMMAAGRSRTPETRGQTADIGGQSSGVRPPPSALRRLSSVLHLPPSAFWFPLCFFLVAVPWPTVIEGPLIQWLTRANAAITIELLNAFGIPALQRGNVIEISTGLVGIDDACSGIRSFQATLMISLFLGELYRLSGLRRLALVFSGFALAFIFNVGRTLLLVTVAAKQGVPAISKWHDPAGVTILVGCFVGLWLIGLWFARRPRTEAGRQMTEISNQSTEHGGREASASQHQPSAISHPPAGSRPLAAVRSPSSALWLCLWLVLVEVGTGLWYRSHEKQLAPAVAWHPAFSGTEADFRELPISEDARRMLRYDASQNVAWINPDGSRWQMIFLRWDGGRVAAHLARSHTPEVCLSAAGHKLQSVSDVKLIAVNGLSLPFRLYTFENDGTSLFVFYCLREDRARGEAFTTEMLTYDNRFAAVQAGRRNLGQRSLEVAIWGQPDAAAAEAALRAQLEKIIVVK